MLAKRNFFACLHEDTNSLRLFKVANSGLHIIKFTYNRCNLCLWEKYFIICKPELAALNKRNELVSSCRHAKKFLLANI